MARMGRIEEGKDVVAEQQRQDGFGINKLLWLVCVVLTFINMSHDLRVK